MSRRLVNARHQSPPSWLEDPDIRKRIYGVFEDYSRHLTIPELCAKHKIGPAQVYRDIRHAKEALRMQWGDDLEVLLDERIEARRMLMRKARETYEVLEKAKPSPPLGLSHEGKAATLTSILAFEAAQLKAIEELMGFRKSGPNILRAGDLGEAASGDVIAVIFGTEGSGQKVMLGDGGTGTSRIIDSTAETISDEPDEDA